MFNFLERFTHVHFPPTVFPRLHYNQNACIKCKMCVKACPTSCLVWDEDRNRPIATALMEMDPACIGCNNCEAVCPVGAIRMQGRYFVKKGRYATVREKDRDMTYPFDRERDKLEEIEEELTETERLILKRRSIRLFKKKEVDKELLLRILEAGRFAPSAGNCQPYKFVVVTDRAINKEIDIRCARVLYRIKELYLTKNRLKKALIYLLSYLSVNKWDQRPIAAMEKIWREKGVITFDAPVVIHILKDRRGISSPDIDVGIAGENMALAAHSLGLGTCFIGFIASALPFAPSVRRLLGIKYPYELALSLCVGYPLRGIDSFVARGTVPVTWIEKANS